MNSDSTSFRVHMGLQRDVTSRPTSDEETKRSIVGLILNFRVGNCRELYLTASLSHRYVQT